MITFKQHLSEEVTTSELKALEKALDRLFAQVGKELQNTK